MAFIAFFYLVIQICLATYLAIVCAPVFHFCRSHRLTEQVCFFRPLLFATARVLPPSFASSSPRLFLHRLRTPQIDPSRDSQAQRFVQRILFRNDPFLPAQRFEAEIHCSQIRLFCEPTGALHCFSVIVGQLPFVSSGSTSSADPANFCIYRSLCALFHNTFSQGPGAVFRTTSARRFKHCLLLYIVGSNLHAFRLLTCSEFQQPARSRLFCSGASALALPAGGLLTLRLVRALLIHLRPCPPLLMLKVPQIDGILLGGPRTRMTTINSWLGAQAKQFTSIMAMLHNLQPDQHSGSIAASTLGVPQHIVPRRTRISGIASSSTSTPRHSHIQWN
ncbi:hypothetical protein KSP39_PZI018781 [Platanthera zijinensis]|uniref:Uncharacterized protein n=1 Tax=Platanthera zijinensis TaxID=2320716 RepID=A0AAP0B3Y6_9ASPA